MAFTQSHHLSVEELSVLLARFVPEQSFAVTRVRSHNKGETRRVVTMRGAELVALVLEALEEGHMSGGDIEVEVPGFERFLAGHHDGVF